MVSECLFVGYFLMGVVLLRGISQVQVLQPLASWRPCVGIRATKPIYSTPATTFLQIVLRTVLGLLGASHWWVGLDKNLVDFEKNSELLRWVLVCFLSVLWVKIEVLINVIFGIFGFNIGHCYFCYAILNDC